MKNAITFVLLGLLAFSCNQKQNNKMIPVNRTDTIVTEKDKAKKELLYRQEGDTIQLLLQNKEGSYIAEGEIDSIHSHIYVKFFNKNISSLKAIVSPTIGEGNIRFNQIISPDKTMDGPFGKELQQELKSVGEYQLVIGRSLMADNPYVGKFKVELQLAPKGNK